MKQYHIDGEILTTAQLRQHEIEFELYERKAKFELGRAEGKEEGKREASVEMARALLERGMNLTEIASITKLSEDQIKVLLN